jgi:hypothetical protein
MAADAEHVLLQAPVHPYATSEAVHPRGGAGGPAGDWRKREVYE